MNDLPPTVTTPSAGRWRSVRRFTRRKERVAAGRALAEGRQAAREALLHTTCHGLWVAEETADHHRDLIDIALADGIDTFVVPAQRLDELCDAVTPQGVVAEVDLAGCSLAELPTAARLVVLCAQVRDPGNAGTVIRCADAFGADAVILTTGSVELGNPKTIRASVGSVFHLPVITGVTLDEAVHAVRGAGLRVWAADGHGADRLDTLTELADPTAWLLGNEAWGLPEDARALADRVVAVPLYGQAESLNLATAAAVCLYTSAAAQRSLFH